LQNFIELLKDHTLILSHIKSLRDIVAHDEPSPGPALHALRRLARLLDAHLRAEADFIRLEGENEHHEFTDLTESHGKLFDAMVAEWTTYLREWDEERVGTDWDGFVHQTGRILDWLTAQVEMENRSLYPAALKYGLIRLLPEDFHETMERRPAAA
jgi:hypothetical protein